MKWIWDLKVVHYKELFIIYDVHYISSSVYKLYVRRITTVFPFANYSNNETNSLLDA